MKNTKLILDASRTGYKGFTREEEGVEHWLQELEISVHFSTGVFPFSSATQHDALAA